MKKKDKEELIELLEIISNDWGWKKLERNNNSWGDCSVHYDDILFINEKWHEKAKRLKSLLT